MSEAQKQTMSNNLHTEVIQLKIWDSFPLWNSLKQHLPITWI